ncbi:MAG: BON domain-containing protein [Candidatus Heimdallarchaeota archaeon]|nr:BON domain-containing protein [Candidatus Heimdallarchaeota archaeon]
MEVNTITDNELKNKIIKQLEWDSRIDASQIKVEVQDGEVTLTGTTTCLFENSVIVNELSKIAGVKKIINNLDMVCITEEIPSDEEIEKNIETLLNIDSTIDASNITIQVNRGVVYIKGTTNSFFQKKEVENAIYRVNGVRGVTNELAVLLTTKKEDKEIAEKITHYIKKSLLAKIDQINVTVNDGAVTLEGCVPHWQVYHSLNDFVKVTQGIKSIDNSLTIDPSGCK